MERHVGREISPNRKLTVALGTMNGEAPQVQAAYNSLLGLGATVVERLEESARQAIERRRLFGDDACDRLDRIVHGLTNEAPRALLESASALN
jgi:hypothetical protein